jgi:hypothetical protein
MTPLQIDSRQAKEPARDYHTLIKTGQSSRSRLHGSMAERKLFSGDERLVV